jgi:hypothetical protein
MIHLMRKILKLIGNPPNLAGIRIQTLRRIEPFDSLVSNRSKSECKDTMKE